MTRRFVVVLSSAGLVASTLVLSRAAIASRVPAPLVDDSSFSASLTWRFVRIRYHAWPEAEARYVRDYGQPPWATDSPASEENLSRRLRTATNIRVEDPIVGLPLDDPALNAHPWIYFVEPGTLHLTDAEVGILREFLLRGGTATFDDFHGPTEWTNLERELARVFPDRKIEELKPPHPVFSCFYQITEYPQVAGLGSFIEGRTWEKGGYTPHLRTILDDTGRPMLMINWNTDMGDGWEWSNSQDFPGYVKYAALAYRMAINEIVYSLTH